MKPTLLILRRFAPEPLQCCRCLNLGLFDSFIEAGEEALVLTRGDQHVIACPDCFERLCEGLEEMGDVIPEESA